MEIGEEEAMACCGSTHFAKEMAKLSPFISLDQAITTARDLWLNQVNTHGWLQAFSAHPQIGESSPPSHHPTSAQWSKGEQSRALATATTSGLQELSEWNVRYKQKFGFIFLICAAGRSSDEILNELKTRYWNRPIVEFEIAAGEQMKITEQRLAKLFATKGEEALSSKKDPVVNAKKVEEDRMSVIGAHLSAKSEIASKDALQLPKRSRPPITTHVLDVSRGAPASGVEVLLEAWRGTDANARPSFGQQRMGNWSILGSSTTDKDGRSGQLMSIIEDLNPGVYRISFNTGKYCPTGFFPYVSIAFEIRESQKREHFHVPLLLSPFSFTTYRGS